MVRATTFREAEAVQLEVHIINLTIVHKVKLVEGLDKVVSLLVARGQDVLKLKLLTMTIPTSTRELSKEALR